MAQPKTRRKKASRSKTTQQSKPAPMKPAESPQTVSAPRRPSLPIILWALPLLIVIIASLLWYQAVHAPVPDPPSTTQPHANPNSLPILGETAGGNAIQSTTLQPAGIPTGSNDPELIRGLDARQGTSVGPAPTDSSARLQDSGNTQQTGGSNLQ